MAEKGLRLTVDSGSARKGAKEITQAMGKVVASGKKAIDTFEKLKAVMAKSGASFEKLKNTTRVVNTGLDTTTKTTNKLTVAQKAYRNVLERTQKSEALMNSVRDGSIEKMYKTEKAYKDEVAAIKKSINAKSAEQKVDEALIKARLKLENTLIAERARTQALTEAMGVNSVRIQEQRRLTEELTRAKARLAAANSQEYADLVRTRQALEMRNKELREGSKKAKVSVDGLASSFTSLGIILGGVSAYLSVGALARVADGYTNITNKLKAVSNATVDTNSATRELLQLSIDSRSSLEGTMEVYSKMIRVNEDLGKSQSEVVALTEAVSKAVAMSGASVQGAQGALMQFSQAMSGDFKSSGQELNSILEQTPMLAVSMAKGLREVTGDATITTGSLKKMAAAGQLSTELVFDAMIKVLPQIRKQFEATDQTMTSAAEGLSSSFTVMIGEIDKSYGVSESLVKSMKGLGEVFAQNSDLVLKFTAAITGLISAAAIGGLLAIMSLIGGAVIAAVASVGLLAGGLAHVYLETTKSQRALDQTNSSLKDLKDTAEDYNEVVSIMSAAQVQSGMDSINKQILDQTVQLEAAIEEQTRLQGILQGDSNWDKFVGNLSEDLEGNFLVVNEQVEALQALLLGLGERLRALSDRRAAALMDNATKSVEGFESSVKSLNGGLTEREKIDEAYQQTLKKLESDYESTKKQIMKTGDSTERLNLLKKTDMLLTEGQKRALASYNEELDKLLKKSPEIKPTNYMIAYQGIQEEIVALKQGTEAYDELLLRRRAMSDLGDEATDLKVEALVAKYKELGKLLKKEEKDPFASWSNSLIDAANSMKDFADATDSSGKAAAKMQVIVAALTAAQAVQAVVHQATSGDPYTAAARMATIAGMLSSIGALGVSLGGLGGSLSTTYEANQASQGTGTVLGDATAQSESIMNSVEITANASEKLIGINTGMLKALQTMAGAITGASTLISRETQGISFGAMPSISEDPLRDVAKLNILGSSGGDVYDIFDKVTFGITSGLGKLLGGRSKVTDEGVRIIGGSINDLVNNTTVQAFRDIKYKRYAWSSTKRKTQLQGVSQSVENQFQLIFGAMVDTVGEAASSLGMNTAEINSAINSFRVGTTNISTKGMSSEEQEKALSSVFSSIFDRFTEHVFSWATEFQKAGEGLSETLTRVVTNMQVVKETVSQLGLSQLSGNFLSQIQSSEYFVNAAGGYEALAASLTSFVSSFETEERKLEIMQNSLTKALAEQNLTLPATREEFLALAKAQDINTEAGADNLALILGLQDAADSYYSSLEDVNGELETTFQSILDWVAALNGTSISGYESLAYAQANYQQQLQLAQSGDQTALESITSYAQNVLDAANREVGAYADYAAIAAMIASQVTSLTVPAFADGGYHSGGIRLVGEEGPELEFTGSARYLSNADTQAALSGGDSSSSDEAAVEIVNKMMPYLFQLVKNTGKSAKYIERWDADGIPETRDLTGVV